VAIFQLVIKNWFSLTSYWPGICFSLTLRSFHPPLATGMVTRSDDKKKISVSPQVLLK